MSNKVKAIWITLFFILLVGIAMSRDNHGMRVPQRSQGVVSLFAS